MNQIEKPSKPTKTWFKTIFIWLIIITIFGMASEYIYNNNKQVKQQLNLLSDKLANLPAPATVIYKEPPADVNNSSYNPKFEIGSVSKANDCYLTAIWQLKDKFLYGQDFSSELSKLEALTKLTDLINQLKAIKANNYSIFDLYQDLRAPNLEQTDIIKQLNWSKSITSLITKVITIRKVDNAQRQNLETSIALARSMIASNQLANAILQIESLPEIYQMAFANWLVKAHNIKNSLNLIEQIQQSILDNGS